MELRDLEYFAIVAEHGNLRRAAEALDLSQPALSKSLRRLEQTVGTKVVKRTPKGVELTVVGRAMLQHARRLQLSRDDIAREVADLRQGRAGYLRVGVGTGVIDQPIAIACSMALKDSPAAQIKVSVASNADLRRALRDGDLDLAVSGIPASPPEDLVQERLQSDKFVVFASADHPLTRKKHVTLANLAGERWALSGTDGLSRKQLERAFEDGGLPPPWVALEAPSLSVRLKVTATSRMLGFNSTAVLEEAARQYRFAEIPLRELTWERSVGISYRKDAYLSPLARRFIEILKAAAKESAAGIRGEKRKRQAA